MLNGITLLKGATSNTITGGTATVFSSDGLEVKNGIHVIDESVTDLTVVPHMTFRNKPHALQSDSSFSKGKRNFNFTFPYTLADGSISYQVFRGEMELHPEIPASVVLEMRLMSCQMIMDAEADNYFNSGSVL